MRPGMGPGGRGLGAAFCATKRCATHALPALHAALPIRARRQLGQLAGELEAARLRGGVLMDSLEALSAGSGSEQAQRLVALAAQLAAAHDAAAAQEARAAALLVRGRPPSLACTLPVCCSPQRVRPCNRQPPPTTGRVRGARHSAGGGACGD